MAEWEVPSEIITRILAFLQVRDLVRLCLVCKEWKSIILFSPYFHELHSRLCHPEKGILCLKNESTSCSRYFPIPEKASSFGSIGPLNIPGFRVCCSDRGLVCICDHIDDSINIFKVGNPFLNSWKAITSPSQYFDPIAMSVEEESGAYMILATNLDAPETDLELEADPPGLRNKIMAEVFDSKRNCWIQAATLDWERVPRSGHIWSAVLVDKYCRVASYSFDQDCWSSMHLGAPYSRNRVCILCNGRAIVVECFEDPLEIGFAILLRSMCNISYECIAFLDEPDLFEVLKGPWKHLLTIGKDESIVIFVESLSRILVLEYDLVRHSWRLFEVPDFLQVRMPNLKFVLEGVTVLFAPSFLQP